MTATIIIGLLIPLLGTMLGSAFVFMMKDEMSARLQKTLLGFASGVMVAASVWSLLIPAMEMEADSGVWSVVPAAVGFLLGIGFLLLIDELTPHLHIGTDKPEGIRSHLSKQQEKNNNKTEISQLLVKDYQQMPLKTSKQIQNRYLCGVNETSIIHTP